MRDTPIHVAIAVLLVVSTAGATVTASHNGSPHWTYEDGHYATHEYYASDQYQKTVQDYFEGLPNGSHSVGDKNATFHSFAVPGTQIDTSFDIHHYQRYSPIRTAECGVGNVVGAGIDRGNDDPGTTVDVSLVNAYERQYFYDSEDDKKDPPVKPRGKYVAPEGSNYDKFDEPWREVLGFEFAQGGELSRTVTVHPGDEIVLGLADCNNWPDEPGWYRTYSYLNGTSTETDETVEFFHFSNWVYICDCDTRSDAFETLGPPPGEGGSSDGGSGATPTPTATATPTATVTQGGGDSTPTSGGGGGGGATATPTTGGGTGGTPTPTASSASSGTTSTPTATGGGGASGGGGATPTVGSGPGFGALAAVLALLAAGLLVHRRRG